MSTVNPADLVSMDVSAGTENAPANSTAAPEPTKKMTVTEKALSLAHEAAEDYSLFVHCSEAELRAQIEAVEAQLKAELEALPADPLPRPWDDEATGSGGTSKGGKGGDGDAGVDFDDLDLEGFSAPEHCIPIRADVVEFDWKALGDYTKFDCIMMDPPWQLSSAMPTRGVAVGYSTLSNADIANIPIPELQENGFLFVWVINSRYDFTLQCMKKWGYELVDDITWVKRTVNRRFAKGHGFYLQHAKESCLVGRKGRNPEQTQLGAGSDVIYSERRGQSQKPEEIYRLIESLVPNGKYLEIFGRKNNLRDYWVTVGNEL